MLLEFDTSLSRMVGRLRSALNAVRPRNLAQLRKTTADLHAELRHVRLAAKELREQTAAEQRLHDEGLRALTHTIDALAADHGARLDAIARQLAEFGTQLELLRRRESQLRAIAVADARLVDEERELDAVLQHPYIASHVHAAIDDAVLHGAPFPYLVIDDVFPDRFFDALVKGLPPVELFEDRPVNHQHLKPPFSLAPAYSRRIWRFMASTVTEQIMRPAVVEKFRHVANSWLRENFPSLASDPLSALSLKCSDGRLLLRRRGYRIPPHRDPKWGFITTLVYLPRPGDDSRWGTQLYAVDEDEDARGAKPYWIEAARCRLIQDVEFKRNRALVFLNSVGAHGAVIPEDAEPADLERYIYQFRIGPDADTIRSLLDTLPEDRRVFWSGKLADY